MTLLVDVKQPDGTHDLVTFWSHLQLVSKPIKLFNFLKVDYALGSWAVGSLRFPITDQQEVLAKNIQCSTLLIRQSLTEIHD